MLRHDTNSQYSFLLMLLSTNTAAATRLVNGQVLATLPIDPMAMMKSSSIRFYHLVWSLMVSSMLLIKINLVIFGKE
jgi:hypothetical protein